MDIRADGNYALDPSHPAFYLQGQDSGAGNHSAFAALDPCRKGWRQVHQRHRLLRWHLLLARDAAEFGDPLGTCSPQMNKCAKRDERCKTSVDCCPPEPGQEANSCIAGFCAFTPLN